MTVCIAALNTHANAIVCACDAQLTTEAYAADRMAIKVRNVHPQWVAMYAASDLPEVLGVLSCVAATLGPMESPSVEAVQTAFAEAYAQRLKTFVETHFLSRLGLDRDEFVRKGRTMLGAAFFSDLAVAVSQADLGCSFVVCGHDGLGAAHLFEVHNPGEVEDKSTPGFAVIGTGCHMAQSILYFHGINTLVPMWRTIYQVAEAKFMAERDKSVGEHTFLFIKTPAVQWRFIPPDDVTVLRTIWQERGAPNIPKDAARAIHAMRFPTSEEWAKQDAEQRAQQDAAEQPGVPDAASIGPEQGDDVSDAPQPISDPSGHGGGDA